MIDIRFIREQPDEIQAIANAKHVDIDISELLRIDDLRRRLQRTTDELRAEKNIISSRKDGVLSDTAIQRAKSIKEELQTIEEKKKKTERRYRLLLERVPNIPTKDTPIGNSEEDNVKLREVGEKPEFSFPPKPHWELGVASGMIQFKQAAIISGSRFAYLMGDLVLLQFALLHFALDVLTKREMLRNIIDASRLSVPDNPFVPVLPPSMIRPDVLRNMARLDPKEDKYYLPEDDLFLAGSAEHALGPLHADTALQPETLPIRYVGYSTAFRREAGAHGKDVRGILRMHQFDKLEMESFTVPEQGLAEHEFLIAIQEYIMQQLEIPYQVILKCTADMGTPDARAVDIECWMPGQDRYRETHTADYMTDYQSRRLGIRMNGTTESPFVHMNDATALAMGRTMIALIENHQREDGTIRIPDAIAPYLSGRRSIGEQS